MFASWQDIILNKHSAFGQTNSRFPGKDCLPFHKELSNTEECLYFF